MSKRNGIIINCIICSKEFYCRPSDHKKYCSYTCRDIAHRKYKHSDETRKKMGKAIKNNLPSTVFKKGQIGCTAGKELPKGKDSRHWKGGKIKQSRGYICVYSPTHPHCQKGRCSGYVYEHRLVMEKHIGRYLEQGEVVHHINRITNDNRIENLILFKNQSEHRKHHGIENKKH